MKKNLNPVLYLSEHGNSGSKTIPPPLVQHSVVSQTPHANVSYEIVDTWTDNSLQTVVVSPEYVNEADMRVIGEKIRSSMTSRANSFVFIFTNKDAAHSHGKVLSAMSEMGVDANEELTSTFNDPDMVGSYNKTPKSGELFTMYLGGTKTNPKEVRY